MEFDANRLAQALRGEQAAKAELATQQAQMQRGQGLVDNTPGGGRNIFAALSGNMDCQRGREMVSDSAPRLKQATQKYAQRYGAEKLYNAEKQADQTQYSRDQDASQAAIQADNTRYEREWQGGALGRAVEQARQVNSLTANDFNGGGDVYEDTTDPSRTEVAFMTDKGPVDERGNPVNLDGMVKRDTSAGGGGGAGWRSRAAAEGEAYKLYNQRSGAAAASQIAQDFSSEDLAQLEDLQPRLARALAEAATPAAFTEMLKGEFSSVSPKMREFLNEINLGGSVLRNSLFGSALTTNEERNSNSFIANAPGIRLSAILRRLGTVDNTASRGLINLDSAYEGSNFAERRQFEGVMSYDDLLLKRKTKSVQDALAANPPAEFKGALGYLLENPDDEEVRAALVEAGVLK